MDHLGTPRLAIGEDGVERWRWDQLEPFGDNVPIETMGTEGYPINLPLRFPGQYADKETSLHYNYFRDYDPGIGRYVQSDPIGLLGGIGTYAYVDSDPLSYVDVDGLAKKRYGGPWKPPAGLKFGCRPPDTCPQIERKMRIIERMIESHEGWDRHMPWPRGGGRHTQEIDELYNAYGRCLRLWYQKKCGDCLPEETSFQKWWRKLTEPGTKAAPDPVEELEGQSNRSGSSSGTGRWPSLPMRPPLPIP